MKRYFIKTFGCQQNEADSERIASVLNQQGMQEAKSIEVADYVVINTCMVRESAENRTYGLVNKLTKNKRRGVKIVITGCMVGLAMRSKSDIYRNKLRKIMPLVDEFLPIEEVGFDLPPVRKNESHAWIPISNGCNNYCTYCVVPFARGREISRPINNILDECKDLKIKGYAQITLLGQNVNSYGADIVLGEKNAQKLRDTTKTAFFSNTSNIKIRMGKKKIVPVYVKHLGRMRIPTLFPHLLKEVAQIGFEKVSFISSNPWDFTDELIEVIARHSNISRTIHLPVQAGDNAVLKRMNRWYTREEYIALTERIRTTIPGVNFTTDIIVGFCGETDKAFDNTVSLAKQVGFIRAYIAIYSPRPSTASQLVLMDNVPHSIKKERWKILNSLINTTSHLSS